MRQIALVLLMATAALGCGDGDKDGSDTGYEIADPGNDADDDDADDADDADADTDDADADADDADADDDADFISVLDIINGEEDLTIFAELVTAIGGASMLPDTTNYTVFAPNNAAFNAFLEDADMTREELIGYAESGEDLHTFTYHFIEGDPVMSSDLEAVNFLQAMGGHTMIVTTDEEGAHINGDMADVARADRMADNGVVHVLDDLIGALELTSVSEILPDHFSMAQDVALRGDTTPITGDEDSPPHTVFAPTNEAFDELLSSLSLTTEEFFALDIDFSTLFNHFVTDGALPTSDLEDGSFIMMLNGEVMSVAATEEGYALDGAPISIPDIVCRNGVWHGLGSALLPPNVTDDILSGGGSSDAPYSSCTVDADCDDGMFCGIECWTGGCGAEEDIPAGTMGAFCQPCDECHYDSDAVSGSCDTCGGSLEEDPSPDCSAATDLYFRAEARLESGTVPDVFSTTDTIIAAGVIENMSECDLPYGTTSTCLLSSASISGPSPWMEAPMCGMAMTTHTVPATAWTEATFTVGTLAAGEYTLTVSFGGGESATQDFTVAAP